MPGPTGIVPEHSGSVPVDSGSVPEHSGIVPVDPVAAPVDPVAAPVDPVAAPVDTVAAPRHPAAAPGHPAAFAVDPSSLAEGVFPVRQRTVRVSKRHPVEVVRLAEPIGRADGSASRRAADGQSIAGMVALAGSSSVGCVPAGLVEVAARLPTQIFRKSRATSPACHAMTSPVSLGGKRKSSQTVVA